MSERTIAKSSATKNPPTAKPGTIEAASMIRSALMTIENNPSVRTLIGKVNSTISGLINMLIRPITSAAKSAPMKVTLTPGTKKAARIIANAEINQCNIADIRFKIKANNKITPNIIDR
jgi:hypothetical protein